MSLHTTPNTPSTFIQLHVRAISFGQREFALNITVGEVGGGRAGGPRTLGIQPAIRQFDRFVLDLFFSLLPFFREHRHVWL